MRIDVGLAEILALEQKPRAVGFGAGVAKTVGEVQPRRVSAVTRTFSNWPSAARGEIFHANAIVVSRRTMLDVRRRSAFSISISKSALSASEARIATNADVSIKISGPKARRFLLWSCHEGSALPSPASRAQALPNARPAAACRARPSIRCAKRGRSPRSCWFCATWRARRLPDHHAHGHPRLRICNSMAASRHATSLHASSHSYK